MKSEHSREQSMRSKPSSYESGEQLVTIDKELAKLITDDIITKARIKHLEALIDQCLDSKDEQLFMTLTAEYISLTR
ncbi:IDEAL domain-containing protein [Pullulanibacillus sp. KACC 23026]|uniref:IDEAL domain-containing protein n=1 Tax=Pullulanibacillus sp. KACC 23026 TaxID=3028315 RepID=UPI0023AEE326|nr:IDEAL domain-containing protein [Pullulanibacillus sp. KACC 23026]WEG10872.1 IDEAL domain-containing protein [Pullulanibacillus sp. KACC 23026]